MLFLKFPSCNVFHKDGLMILACLQPVEYTLNAVLAAFLLVCGKWIAAAIHICISLWNLRTYLQRDHIVDVTEIFRQLPKQKMMRMVKLVIFLFAFVLIIYRSVLSLFCDALEQLVACVTVLTLFQTHARRREHFCIARVFACVLITMLQAWSATLHAFCHQDCGDPHSLCTRRALDDWSDLASALCTASSSASQHIMLLPGWWSQQ